MTSSVAIRRPNPTRDLRRVASFLVVHALPVCLATNAPAQCDDYAKCLPLVGSMDTSGFVEHICIVDELAYVADGSAGLLVIDVSDPAAPLLVGAVDTPGTAYGVAAADKIAYVADGGGLAVIDATEPAAPRLAGRVSLPGVAFRVVIAGTHAVVACGYWGLQIVDVSDPSNPRHVGGLTSVGLTLGIAVAEDTAYLASWESGFVVVDIGDPQSPLVVASLPAYGARDVVVDGQRAYLGSGFLHVIDVADPHQPSFVGQSTYLEEVAGLALSGPHVLAVGDHAGLQVLDVTASAQPLGVGVVYLSSPRAVAVRGGFAYVAAGEDGLRVFDAAEPHCPGALGGTTTPGDARDVAVRGDYAYVADYISGLAAIDCSDPALPLLTHRVDLRGGSQDVVIAGDYALVATRDFGLQVVSLANAAYPRRVGGLDAAWYAWGVDVADDLAVIAAYDAGLQLVDISSPSEPQAVGSIPLPGLAWKVAVAGDYAFVAAHANGLHVVDISDRTHPVLVGSVDTPGHALDVAVRDGCAYVADSAGGLQVVDVSDPALPRIVGHLVTPDNAIAVKLSGRHAYVAAARAGLLVIDIADPVRPRLTGANRASWPVGVDIASDRVYVADYNFRLLPAQCEEPQAVYLLDLSVVRAGRRAVLTWSFSSAGDFPAFRVWREEYGRARELLGHAAAQVDGNGAFTDAIAPAIAVDYWLEEPVVGSQSNWHGPARLEALALPVHAGLALLGPNPLNPRTTFAYELPVAGRVRLAVFDARGRHVATLIDAELAAGAGVIGWDGSDAAGRPVPSGLYVARLEAPNGAKAVKVTVAR